MPIEIFLGEELNISPQLKEPKKQRLIELLKLHAKVFAWDYTDMNGIHPSL